MDKGMDFYNKEINQILSIFNSNEKGLTSFQSQTNISKYGKNTLKNDKKISFFARFLAQFKNIMIIILLISSAVSIFLAINNGVYSDLIEGGTILLIVIANAIIGVVQEKKADDAIEKLKQQTCHQPKSLSVT